MPNPVIRVQMLIRRPAEEIYQAFVDPSITTKFWFTKSSGPLEVGKKVVWEWEMYGAKGEVNVLTLIPNKLIKFDWDNPSNTVEICIEPFKEGQNIVVINNYGFTQQGDDLLAKIMDSTSGFTTVLDNLKAYLEHGINLNLIFDKFPQAHI